MILRCIPLFIVLLLAGCGHIPQHKPIMLEAESEETAQPVMLLSYPADMSRDDVASHLSWLRITGYNPVKVNDILTKREDTLPLKPVVLYFENTGIDFRDHILPLLKLHSFPALLSMPSDSSLAKNLKKTGLVDFAADLRSFQTGSSFSLWRAKSKIMPRIFLFSCQDDQESIGRAARGLNITIIITCAPTTGILMEPLEKDLVGNWPQISAQPVSILKNKDAE